MTSLVNSGDEEESKALHKSTPSFQIVPLLAQKIIDPVAVPTTPEITSSKAGGIGLNGRAIRMQVSFFSSPILSDFILSGL